MGAITRIERRKAHIDGWWKHALAHVATTGIVVRAQFELPFHVRSPIDTVVTASCLSATSLVCRFSTRHCTEYLLVRGLLLLCASVLTLYSRGYQSGMVTCSRWNVEASHRKNFV
ncbi:hypothetical protein C8Q76DRAFT_703032, partial [Earliella scabrosa]